MYLNLGVKGVKVSYFFVRFLQGIWVSSGKYLWSTRESFFPLPGGDTQEGEQPAGLQYRGRLRPREPPVWRERAWHFHFQGKFKKYILPTFQREMYTWRSENG